MVYFEHARLQKKLNKILEEHSNLGHRLKSVLITDLFTRYDLIFEDSDKKYSYIHKSFHLTKKIAPAINECEKEGYKLVFHLAGDFTTSHELFFEKEIE